MYYLYIMHFNSDALVYICMFVCIYIRIYVYNTCFCQFQTSYLLCYSTHVRKCLGIPNPTSEDNKEHNDCSHHLIPSLLSLSYCMMNKKTVLFLYVCYLLTLNTNIHIYLFWNMYVFHCRHNGADHTSATILKLDSLKY